MKVYLAGPIFGKRDAECKGWRMDVRMRHPEIEFFDPLQRDYRGKEDENVREIITGDKVDILNSDIVFADCTEPSVGTSMEIMFAHMNGIPVIAVSSRPSPWLLHHATVYPTLFDAEDGLRTAHMRREGHSSSLL